MSWDFCRAWGRRAQRGGHAPQNSYHVRPGTTAVHCASHKDPEILPPMKSSVQGGVEQLIASALWWLSSAGRTGWVWRLLRPWLPEVSGYHRNSEQRPENVWSSKHTIIHLPACLRSYDILGQVDSRGRYCFSYITQNRQARGSKRLIAITNQRQITILTWWPGPSHVSDTQPTYWSKRKLVS